MPDLPRLDIRHHGLLLALDESGGLQAAADRLGITQSAASHRLREAERRLGLALVRRVGRRVQLTPAGERLLAAARLAVGELARAERELVERFGQGRPLVRLGQAPYSRYHWLPAFLEFLGARHPTIELDLVARAATDPLGCLRDGTADVVMLYGRQGQGGDLVWLRLGGDPLVAVMAPGHRLAAKAEVTAADLAGERYITYSNRPEPGFEWESVLRPAGVAPQRVSVVGLPEAIIDLVRAGVGVSSLSRWAVSPELADGTLVARPLRRPGARAPGLSLDWWVVYRQADAGRPAEQVAQALQASSRLHGVGLDVQSFGEPAV